MRRHVLERIVIRPASLADEEEFLAAVRAQSAASRSWVQAPATPSRVSRIIISRHDGPRSAGISSSGSTSRVRSSGS